MNLARTCRYCSRTIMPADRAALCDRCHTAHHEECWDRNGRCSTFRCNGQPRTMRGEDVAPSLLAALAHANDEPQRCPFCGDRVYAGALVGKRPNQGPDRPAGPGLLFTGRQGPTAAPASLGKRLLARVRGGRSWFLPGAELKARSCGKCRRLFVWSAPVDDDTARRREVDGERYCPHCVDLLWSGQIVLRPSPLGARFVCDSVPALHADWFGHNVLDRFFLNRWKPEVSAVPANSCPDCLYTEVLGTPIYHFE